MQFTILLIMGLKKVNIGGKWQKKHFNGELVMTEGDNEDFKNSTE